MSDIRTVPRPTDETEVVQVLMTERQARLFETYVLKSGASKGHLSGPVTFGEDETPTYIIGID